MQIVFAQPGLHRVRRGAEAAFESLAAELARGGDAVTLIGAGRAEPGRAYTYRHSPAVGRRRFERLPSLPLLRSVYMAEELTFAPGLWWTLRNLPCDVTLTADFPYVNLTLRMARHRPRHVFVTQNGDWGPQGIGTEAKLFRCDGLVCTNPVYYARNADRWRCRLIPNGVDTTTFRPGDARRDDFDLPAGLPLVLIVSAPSGTKRVDEAIRAVSRLDGFGLVVAGDGPDNALVDALGAELMPGRYFRRVLPHEQMPDLYRCADVCLHMSLFESFGNVYIEALASGLPVVGHRNEVTEWILGDHGYLVDTTDLEAVAAAVRAGFESGADDARRARAVERFAWARVAEDYRSFLAEVVES